MEQDAEKRQAWDCVVDECQITSDKRDRCRHVLLPTRFFAVDAIGGVEGAQSTVCVRTLDLQKKVIALVSKYARAREVRRKLKTNARTNSSF